MRRKCSRKATESRSTESLERVKRWRGHNNPAGSEFIKSERMYEKLKKGKYDRGRAGEWARYLSVHQRLVMSYAHPLRHPLIPSMPQPNEPSAFQWFLYTAAPHTAIISLCYRQFIALYSSASISIHCCHDLYPSHCHVTYHLTSSIGTDKIFTHVTADQMQFAGWILFISSYPNMDEYPFMWSFDRSWYDRCWYLKGVI